MYITSNVYFTKECVPYISREELDTYTCKNNKNKIIIKRTFIIYFFFCKA